MIVLTDITAMRLWAHEGLERTLGAPVLASGLDLCPESMQEISSAGLEGLGLCPTRDDPLHILVDDPARRIQSGAVRNHVWSGRVPPGSLYRLAPGIAIASPGFCCLQHASRASIPSVVAMEMECLGLYGRQPGPRGFLDRSQLMTTESLRDYLKGARLCPGVNKACRALGWARERSRSPLETKTVIVLVLPRDLGGYGLPIPELNHLVRVLPESYPYSQFAQYEVDICWSDKRTVVECDSYENHRRPEQVDHDSMKRNSLEAMGWNVISVTNGQLSGDSLDVLARQIAKALEVTLRPPTPERRDWLLGQIA